MAQAVFEDSEHPLEQYLRDAGEVACLCPGASPEQYVEEDNLLEPYEVDDLSWMPPWLEQLIVPLLPILLQNPGLSSAASKFAERFKYTVISSSLLASSLSPPGPTARISGRLTPLLPGHLPNANTNPSATLEVPTYHAHLSPSHNNDDPSTTALASASASAEDNQVYWPYAIAAATFGAGHYFTSLVLMALSLYYTSHFTQLLESSQLFGFSSEGEAETLPTLQALQDLVDAHEAWETLVSEAFCLLETQDPSSPSLLHSETLYTSSVSASYRHQYPPSPSWSMALRVALQSNLHTSATQCDHIRHLFTAVSSSELGQIAEMYAPPSPVPRKETQSFVSSKQAQGVRPFSLPSRRPMSVVGPRGGSGKVTGMSITDKRSTWNGSYLTLAHAGTPPSAMSPSFPPLPPIPHSATNVGSPTSSVQSSPRQASRNSSRVTPRRMKWRSDLSSVFQTPLSMRGSLHMVNASLSAPATPSLPTEGRDEATGKDLEDSGIFAPGHTQDEDQSEDGGLKYLESDDESDEKDPDLPGPGSFGVDALALRRRRRHAKGLSVISTIDSRHPHPSSPPTTISSPRSQAYTQATSPRGLRRRYSASASKFTSFQSPASRGPASDRPDQNSSVHPLSMASIQGALHRALASKRYAASHLLALRFDVESRGGGGGGDSDAENGGGGNVHRLSAGWDEGYWENVRSVMSLMSGALGDAAARVGAAVDSAREELRRGPDQHDHVRRDSVGGADLGLDLEDVGKAFVPQVALADTLRGLDMGGPTGFAPIPGQLARFAAHVEAIEGALSGAREELARCVQRLLEESGAGPTATGVKDAQDNVSIRAVSPAPSASSSSSIEQPLLSAPSSPLPPLSPQLHKEQPTQRHLHRASVPTPPVTSPHPALQAYEDLRRELGQALRECERGRERLLDLLSPPRSSHSDDEDDLEIPALGADLGSDESDAKRDSSPRSLRDFPAGLDQVLIRRFSSHDPTTVSGREVDDVTAHLLLESNAANLPAVGVEQVYEADTSGGATFGRERSKLSREERIRMVKEQREQRASMLVGGGGISGPASAATESVSERWGPGGDVVKELKDVISEVGKRRRAAVEGQAQSSGQSPRNSLGSSEATASGNQQPRSPSPQNPFRRSSSPQSLFRRSLSPPRRSSSLRDLPQRAPPPQNPLPAPPPEIQVQADAQPLESEEEEELDETPGDLQSRLRSSMERLRKEMRLSVAELRYSPPGLEEEDEQSNVNLLGKEMVRGEEGESPVAWIPPPGLS